MTTEKMRMALSTVLWASSLGSASVQAQQVESPAPNADEVGIEAIVVTAQRRSERMQDVPIAVSALTARAAEAQGNFDTMSLPTQIPTLQTSRQVTGFTAYLRGVGTFSSPGNENAIATYVDDVYIQGFGASVIGFNNIERVEVIKGPQGTLFGRNASGGVIHVITKEPSQTPELDVQVGYANYSTFSSNLYGTTGIGPNLAVDIAFFSRAQNDGWGKNLETGQHINFGEEYGLRSKLKWTPGENTSVTLEADHYWTNYDYGVNPSVAKDTLSSGGGTWVGNYNNQSTGGPSRNHQTVNGQTVTIEHQFSGATLRSITAARNATGGTTYDQDAGPLDITNGGWRPTLEQYTQEFHVISPAGAEWGGHGVRWQGGIFLMRMDEGLVPLTAGGLALGSLDFKYQGWSKSYTRSYAGFLDGTVELLTGTNLTLGARYTEDRIKNTSYTEFTVAPGVVFSTGPLDQHADADKPTYRAILDHKFTDDFMAYTSFSTGFKSGGFANFAALSAPTFPEELTAYALGAKTEWLDDRLQINMEIWDYDYKNQQVLKIVNNGAFQVNAARSHLYGLDVNIMAAPISGLTLSANYGYLHGRYKSFPDASIYVQQPAACDPNGQALPTRLPGPLVPDNISCSFNAAGYPTVRSPTHSGNVSVDYLLLKTAFGTLNMAANYFRTSAFHWDPSGQFPEPGYGLLASSVTWNGLDGKYDIQLWCTNCTNTYHDTFIAESLPSQQRAPEAPREFGLRFGAHFK